MQFFLMINTLKAYIPKSNAKFCIMLGFFLNKKLKGKQHYNLAILLRGHECFLLIPLLYVKIA